MIEYKPQIREKYERYVLTDVVLQDEGFEIKHGSWCFWVPHKKNLKNITPKIGDTAFFYGDGMGYTVLGLQINDDVVFSKTREEEKRDRNALLKAWSEQNKKEYVELMEKIKDEPEFETVSVSGFGSGYERGCQLMIQAGIKYLKENEFHFDYYTFKGVYGLCMSDAPWTKDFEKVLMDAVNGDCTGAMHHCVIGHLQYIYKHGYDEWLNQFSDERKYVYPKELPPPK